MAILMHATLNRSGGVEAVARRLSVRTPVAAALTRALLPLVLGAYRDDFELSHRATGSAEAACAALEDMLVAFGGRALSTALVGSGPMIGDEPVALRNRVFGSPAGAEAVVAHAAATHPLDIGQLSAALTVLTMLVGSYIAARIGSAETIDETVVAHIVEILDVDGAVNPLHAMRA